MKFFLTYITRSEILLGHLSLSPVSIDTQAMASATRFAKMQYYIKRSMCTRMSVGMPFLCLSIMALESPKQIAPLPLSI